MSAQLLQFLTSLRSLSSTLANMRFLTLRMSTATMTITRCLSSTMVQATATTTSHLSSTILPTMTPNLPLPCARLSRLALARHPHRPCGTASPLHRQVDAIRQQRRIQANPMSLANQKDLDQASASAALVLVLLMDGVLASVRA